MEIEPGIVYFPFTRRLATKTKRSKVMVASATVVLLLVAVYLILPERGPAARRLLETEEVVVCQLYCKPSGS